jgi:hypothetical protein
MTQSGAARSGHTARDGSEAGSSEMPWGCGLGKGGGTDANEMQTPQRWETHLSCTHGAYEITRDAVGLGDPIARGLASTRRGNRWWVGRALQMAENLPDHLGLGDGGDNPSRPLTAKRTGGHI